MQENESKSAKSRNSSKKRPRHIAGASFGTAIHQPCKREAGQAFEDAAPYCAVHTIYARKQNRKRKNTRKRKSRDPGDAGAPAWQREYADGCDPALLSFICKKTKRKMENPKKKKQRPRWREPLLVCGNHAAQKEDPRAGSGSTRQPVHSIYARKKNKITKNKKEAPFSWQKERGLALCAAKQAAQNRKKTSQEHSFRLRSCLYFICKKTKCNRLKSQKEKAEAPVGKRASAVHGHPSVRK